MTILALAEWVVRATVVFAFAAILASTLRRNAQAQRLIWVGAFVTCALLPLVFSRPIEAPVVVTLPSLQAEAQAFPVEVVWVAGTALVAAWYLLGWTSLFACLKRSRLFGIIKVGTRRVRVLIARRESGPFTFGTLSPMVVLPASAIAWPEDRLRAVLIHELGHVRRYDATFQLLAQLLCAAMWFNPAAWLALREFRSACELAADESVLEAGVRPSDYAAALLSLARRKSAVHGFAVPIARTSAISRRIREIVSPGPRHHLRLRHRLAGGLLCGLALAAGPSLQIAVPQAPSQAYSEGWQSGFLLGQAYKASHPFASRDEPTLTEADRREIELQAIRNRGTP